MNTTDWTTAQFVAMYVVALIVLGALDGVWLGWLAKDFYKSEMGQLMADSPRLIPAAIFYLAYPVGLAYFALGSMSDTDASAAQGFMRSAAFGLIAYGTYDLTNMSVIREFSVRLALADMVWGTLASGVAGTAALVAAKWWAQRG